MTQSQGAVATLFGIFDALNAHALLERSGAGARAPFQVEIVGEAAGRRFTAATGLAPIAYVQRLRIEDAKRPLERTDAPVDEISSCVGYEDAALRAGRARGLAFGRGACKVMLYLERGE